MGCAISAQMLNSSPKHREEIVYENRDRRHRAHGHRHRPEADEQGAEIVAWNRTKERTKPLADAGATIVSTPAELVKSVDTVITILTDAAAIDATYRGKDGLLSGDATGRLFIEMSTVTPETEKKLAADISAKGAEMVEAPVGGSTGPAKEGKLIGLVGGKEADVARARPVLEKLCRRVEHVGPDRRRRELQARHQPAARDLLAGARRGAVPLPPAWRRSGACRRALLRYLRRHQCHAASAMARWRRR